MADRLEAAKTAVLGLHLQKHMTDPASPVAQHTGFAEMVKKTNLFDNINRVLSAAREKGIFIAYIQLDLSPGGYRYPLRGEFCRSSPPSIRQVKSSARALGDMTFTTRWCAKKANLSYWGRHISAFAGSGLDDALKTRGITDLVLTGVATNFVVTNTAWSAIDRGYSCLVLEDCCTSGSEESHRDAIDHLRPIADIWQSQNFIDAMTR